MMAGTSYRQGAVVLVPFPFTDQSGSKVRPALVVSSDLFNDLHSDIVLAAITTQIPVAPDPRTEIVLGHADVAAGRIKQTSIIKTAKLFTCETGLIRRQVATIQTAKLAEVLAALRALFS
jgi:mRNA interferase MazF